MSKDIIIGSVRKLEFNDWGNVSYQNEKISKGWGSRVFFYYDESTKELHCQNFNLFQRFIHHFFGYKKEFGKRSLVKYLELTHIANESCPKKADVTEFVIRHLNKYHDMVRDFKRGLHDTNVNERRLIAFFESGLDINERISGHTPLQYAAQNKRFYLLKHLVEHGADVNAMDTAGGYVPLNALHWAIYNKDEKTVLYLLEHGADITAPNAYGESPVHQILESFETYPKTLDWNPGKILDVILAKKPELNTVDRNGRTPLQIACQENLFPQVRQLVAAGAKVDFGSQFSPSPLLACVNNLEMTQELIRLGASIEAFHEKQTEATRKEPKDHHERALIGCMPKNLLEEALKNSLSVNIEYLAFLLEHGVELPRDALRLAVFSQKIDIVKLMVKHGADVNYKNSLNETALHHAAYLGCFDIAEFLMEQDIEIQAPVSANVRPQAPEQIADGRDFSLLAFFIRERRQGIRH